MGGANWSKINTCLPDNRSPYIQTLAIDPVTPTTVYAGTGNGMFKTTDGGANWFQIGVGLPHTCTYSEARISTFAIDPVTPAIVFAGSECGGVFKTTDGGANWSRIPGPAPISLAIDPVTPTTIYIGVPGDEDGVYKTTDGGATWFVVNNGLSNEGLYVDVAVDVLAVDPLTPAIVYAGTSGGGVFKTTDGGTNWSKTNPRVPNSYVSALAIDPVTPTTIYAGGPGGVFVYRETEPLGPVAPTPDITVNGSAGPVTIVDGSPSVTISLESGNLAGTNADWWLAVDTPAGWYCYDIFQGAWVPGLSFLVYQGPLFDFPPVELSAYSNITTGTCTFYFGIDTTMNGNLDNDLYYDYVVVQLSEN